MQTYKNPTAQPIQAVQELMQPQQDEGQRGG
jgi:hypothetical protein